MAGKLRIGAVAYLNARPLVFGMERGLGAERIELSLHVPGRLAELMAAQALDVALLPTIELGRIPGLEIVPGLGVVTRGPSRSVKLAGRRPPETARTVALDPESRTSNALVQVLFAEVWGRRPEFRPGPRDLEQALAESDAAVRIGDKALFEPVPNGVLVHDLGEVWTQATGLPFVFAVWAARAGAVDREIVEILHRSWLEGAQALDRIAASYAWNGATHPEISREYLRGHIFHGLGSEELTSIETFFSKAADLGIIAHRPELRVVSSGGTSGPRAVERSPEPRAAGDAATAAALEAVTAKVLEGTRISPADALLLLERARLTDLGALADLVRRRKHPQRIVSFIVDRNVNYTNVCNAFCSFCAFYRPPHHEEGYVLPFETIEQKVRETYALGGRQILLQGGHNPALGIDYYEELFRRLKAGFPDLWLHALSPPEITHIRKASRLPLGETIRRLRAAGLDSLPGGGAEILVDRVRTELAKNKCSAGEWLEVMEEAHRQGLRSTATMMFGHVETLRDRVEHLDRLRDLQDRTSGFTAFICWTYQAEHTELGGHEVTTAEYLRTLAVSRVFLDNIDNVQASWVTQGPKIGAASLAFGVNDMGSTMIEENVVSAAGTVHSMNEAEIVRAIRDAGFIPKRRDMSYQNMSEPVEA